MTRNITRYALQGCLGILLASEASGICAAQETALPAYSPVPIQSGTIRSWGDDAMRSTMMAWEQAFRAYHPEITFQDTLLGTATSMAGIITNTSDLSLMGRPATVNEVIGFEWVFRVKPLGIQVMNGSLLAEGRTPALAVFVSRSNPVHQLSMSQLATILGCPANPKEPVTWAMAGAEGVWRNKRIHAFLYDDQTGTGAFLQQAIQGTKDCWNWEIVREFKDKTRHDGSAYPAAQQIVDALKHDLDGLAISTLSYANPEIKALPLAGPGAAVPLTRETVTSSNYPLARGVYIYINRGKDEPVDPKVKEFLRFILSREGQALVQNQGDYLPLNPTTAQEQWNKLE
jgi:phosphate transport system substrate-binding protein